MGFAYSDNNNVKTLVQTSWGTLQDKFCEANLQVLMSKG